MGFPNAWSVNVDFPRFPFPLVFQTMASKMKIIAGSTVALATFGLFNDYRNSKSSSRSYFFGRDALAFSHSKGQYLRFDEYFPRGEWDDNWDFRSPEYLVSRKKYELASESEREQMVKGKTATATRNIILIRHGQYQINSPDKFLTQLGGFTTFSKKLQTFINLVYKSVDLCFDFESLWKKTLLSEKRKVSGREQAELVGKRLATSGIKFDEVVMSTMNRATETAKIILQQLPKEQKSLSCSLLEEGPPYPPVPDVSHWKPPASEFFVDGARIESAFRKHIHRAAPEQKEDSYEVLVCHANVIRYFICRLEISLFMHK
ncbi:hypothetical protein WR25_12374 isoform E [Diploscapter pachys]|uniref:Serine/threonine-protein phosphatase PGAM5, mitochondrial n=1 Tax=Diploscapter pachys TaxID=2018661 RepID=A0A2A2J9Y8_9BILA|nr:hypothetical protein WR25_12374 isoform E [Diploscapter pachys]